MKKSGEIRVGISGWTYPRWRKTFYPKGLGTKNEFRYAADHFATIEINGTFYRLQNPAVFQKWYAESPPGIVYSVKGNRFLTHMKRLRDPREGLANFFATGVTELREKLGPILWQFPPNMIFDEARFRDFFAQLPRTAAAAVKLAREHQVAIRGGHIDLKARAKTKLRYAVEIRHDSFNTPKFVDLLREYNIAFVIADTAGRWYANEEVTADFAYLRLHGFKELYAGGYPATALAKYAKKVQNYAKQGDVFLYFDNDAKVNAPFDASAMNLKLAKTKGLILPPVDPAELVARRKTVNKKELLALQDRARKR